MCKEKLGYALEIIFPIAGEPVNIRIKFRSQFIRKCHFVVAMFDGGQSAGNPESFETLNEAVAFAHSLGVALRRTISRVLEHH
jgi:hypothetical protein